MKKLNHADCANFISVDVAKGICHANGGVVILIDTDICSEFTAVAKCKICTKFSNPDEHDIGTCEGFKSPHWTYGELKAVQCEQFRQALKEE